MVSKARLDLPDPESPVTTVRLLRGISTETFFRLCTRAPWTATVVRIAVRRGAASGAPASLRPLRAIGSVRKEERQLLERRGAALGGAHGRRRLGHEVPIREVLAGGGHAVDAEGAREVAVDLAGGANVARVAQIVQHRREEAL